MSRVVFKDVVRRANTKEDRFDTEKIYYVGGEHVDSESVLIDRRGLIKGSSIGPMFYFGFKSGDVLFVSRNPHLKKAGMVSFDGICSEKTFVLETKDESVLLQRFLPFVMQSDHFWDYMEAHKSGGVNFFINWSTLAEYEFELPDIITQNNLSDLLWSINDTKRSYENCISVIDDVVKSQFIEQFGTIDDEKRGYPRKQWKEVLTIINGKDYKKVQVEKDGYPVYGTGGEMARACDYLCPENSIIMGRKGTIDNPLLVKEKFWNVDTAFGVVPSPDYLHYIYLLWYCKQLDFSKLNKATTMPSTTKKDLLNLWINIPPIEQQEQFAKFVEQSDKSKAELNKSIEAVDNLMKSIINQTLS